MEEHYDLVVVGGGSAGYAAASAAVEEGFSVAVVEGAETMGGLCVLRRCMPSKTLIETANRLREIREAGKFAIDLTGEARVDMAALQKRREELVADFAGYRVAQLEGGNFDLLRHTAVFKDSHTLLLGDAEVTFDFAVVATGSTPFVPEIEGLEETGYWLSRDALEADSLPKRLIVLGGGIIGCELGHCFEGLGSQVVIVNRSGSLLTELGSEVGDELVRASRDRGIEVVLSAPSQRAFRDGEEVVLVVETGDGTEREIRGDQLLVATGRLPRVSELALEYAGVSFGKKGIEVNEFGQTSQRHIFAVGDCAEGFQIVHEAVMRGQQAARNASRLREEKPLQTALEDLLILGVFTEPEVIHIGVTREEMDEWEVELEERKFELSDMGKAMIRGMEHGFLKVTYEKESRRLIAATGVGKGVIDFSHTLVFAIQEDQTIEELLETPHYHPTLVEAWTYLED